MSANATPQEHATEPHRTEPQRIEPWHTQQLATDLFALSRNAARNIEANVEAGDEVDYWYRLGQRNAYAHATGLLLAPTLREDPFTIADRVTTSLEANVTDLTQLRTAAYGHGHGGAAPATALAWVGPRAFDARYGNAPGIDHDFGARWGPRGEQRISLRIQDGATHGVLYAYDPTWDEYAVLATDATLDAVQAAFHRANEVDIHLEPHRFVQLVTAATGTPAPTGRVPEPVRAEL